MIESFKDQIKAMSDVALGKSLDRMIFIRFSISDMPVDRHRRKDVNHKIVLMNKEWELRAWGSKSK